MRSARVSVVTVTSSPLSFSLASGDLAAWVVDELGPQVIHEWLRRDPVGVGDEECGDAVDVVRGGVVNALSSQTMRAHPASSFLMASRSSITFGDRFRPMASLLARRSAGVPVAVRLSASWSCRSASCLMRSGNALTWPGHR